MDHKFLVPVLVLLHAVLLPATAAEELPPPELSVFPSHPQYYEGEKVELSCTAKINKTVGGYRFFDPSGSMVHEEVTGGFWSGLLAITVQKEKAGTYSCEYWRKDGGKEVRSKRSNETTLRVEEAPKKPSLTLNHTLLQYRWGDYVSLVCSAPPEVKKIKEFQYIGDKQTIQTQESMDNTYVYNLSITRENDLGNFRCAYIQLLSGRKIRSEKSDSVFIDPAGTSWGRILATGGIFFTVNGLIFLITHCYFLPKVSKRNDF